MSGTALSDAENRHVLATVARTIRDRDYLSADELLAELGWGAERKLPLMRALRFLIDSDYMAGKVLTGDGTILDVMLTGVTEKGLNRLGQ
jgi:hypothetical protein